MPPRPTAIDAVLNERTTLAWPLVVTVIGATWWLSAKLSSIDSRMEKLNDAADTREERLRTIEGWAAKRGPQIDAIEQAVKRL